MKKLKFLLGMTILSILCVSCSKGTVLNVTSVSYQSVRNVRTDLASKSNIPSDAVILIEPIIGLNGSLNVKVTNLTNEVMIIDRTKSFYVTPEGQSITYYDPTVHTTTTSSTSGGQTGASINAGAVAGALGIGGAVGQILGGVNVGGSNLNATTKTNTTYTMDQPQSSLAPHSTASMGRIFSVASLGENFLSAVDSENSNKQNIERIYTNANESYCKFSICISYSLDNGATYDKIVSEFYSNYLLMSPVVNKGKVNAALRTVLQEKKDIYSEPWYLLYFKCNAPTKSHDSLNECKLYDYK